MTNAIQLRNIQKRFDDYHAIKNVSLEIKQGELVALLGPSGSGKTTLLRIIAGLEHANFGDVLIDEKPTNTLNIKQRQVGFVFQHYALFKHMRVFDNVAFGLRVRPKEARPSEVIISKKVMELLELVHLDQFHDRYPSQLSGGQRQRVALARALAVEPKLLLLDEPFGALDAKVRKELRRWLRRLHDETQITTVFVTHDQEEAMEVADRVVVLNRGMIEQEGTPEDVYHKPSNGFVYDFLGNYNEFSGWKDEAGNIHLAEDDLVVSQALRPAIKTTPSLLNRYPEVTRLVGFFTRKKAEPILKTEPISSEMAPPKIIHGTPVKLYCRPHEIFVTRTPEKGEEYIPVEVIHINPAGSLVKLELKRPSGVILQAEVPKNIIDSLQIKKHDTLLIKPKNVRVFE
jgi:sulfate transport system ATP-binding protein